MAKCGVLRVSGGQKRLVDSKLLRNFATLFRVNCAQK